MIKSVQPRAQLAEFVGTTLLVFVAMMTTSLAQVGFGGIAAGGLATGVVGVLTQNLRSGADDG